MRFGNRQQQQQQQSIHKYGHAIHVRHPGRFDKCNETLCNASAVAALPSCCVPLGHAAAAAATASGNETKDSRCEC